MAVCTALIGLGATIFALFGLYALIMCVNLLRTAGSPLAILWSESAKVGRHFSEQTCNQRRIILFCRLNDSGTITRVERGARLDAVMFLSCQGSDSYNTETEPIARMRLTSCGTEHHRTILDWLVVLSTLLPILLMGSLVCCMSVL